MKMYLTKSIVLTIILAVIACSQPSKLFITVSNPTEIERQNETVVLNWANLTREASWLDSSNVAVLDSENNKELITQILENDLLFQSNFKSNETKRFILFNTTSQKIVPESIVDAKFITPREDVAWENDRIAYRIYGSKLAGDVLNGIDVWVKRVRYPIIDKWYAGNALEGSQKISYHIDHGEGADFFTVGRSLGAGGCAIWKDDKIHQTSLFTSHKIIAKGPIRTKFIVSYEKDSINGQPFTEEKIYTLDAGNNLNRIDVSYNGLQVNKEVTIAVGLVKRKNIESFADDKLGLLSLWGLTNDDSANGYTGTGVLVPPAFFQEMNEDKDHYLIIGKSSPKKYFTYYAGACWTRSGDFKCAEDWNAYLKNFVLRLQKPLRITISTKK
ncbi:MAG: DUF4861 family protein [Bacteroidota bacterium]|nr:DUF4861 family protein [Bacteroidota bacterium]